MNDVVVVIRTRRHFIFATLAAAWLVVWVVSGMGALHGAWTDPPIPFSGKVFFAVWSCGWALGTGAVLFAVLRMTGGCERLTVRGKNLFVETGLWSRYFMSPRIFAVSHVRNMGIDSVQRRRKGHVYISHRLAFDYQGQRIRLRCDISEEARKDLNTSPLAALFGLKQ